MDGGGGGRLVESVVGQQRSLKISAWNARTSHTAAAAATTPAAAAAAAAALTPQAAAAAAEHDDIVERAGALAN